MEIASLNLGAASDAAVAPEAPRFQYVGFGRRAWGRVLDTILHWLIGLVVAVAALLLASIVDGTSLSERIQGGPGVAAFALSIFGAILYDIICEGLFGSTAGKYMLGMVVLREDGRPCTFAQAAGRSFVFLIDSLFFGIVAYMSMEDSPRQQRLGDKWCRTVVVTRASAPPASLRSPLRFVGAFVLAVFVDAVTIGAGMLL